MKISLGSLKKEKLHAKFSKYEFLFKSLAFLEHIISKEEVSINSKKIEAIVNGSRLTSVTKVMSFLDLGGYCRKFVEGFCPLAIHLSRLTPKQARFFFF